MKSFLLNTSFALEIIRKILRSGLWIVGLASIPIAITVGVYLFQAKSNPFGKKIAPLLRDEVSITFDQSDIPHIEAKNGNDAFFALGYLHARERTWQMEFNRRLASGSLSEILGEATLSIDRFIRTLGIRTAARAQFELLPSSTKLSLEAYANGVNSGFSDLGWALPVEFFLIGTKPGIWTAIDSVSWSMMMALDLGDNWHKEFIRLQLSKNLSTEQIWEILPPYPGDPPLTNLDFAKMYQSIGLFNQDIKSNQTLSTPEKNLLAWLPTQTEGKGSNNWTLSGENTISQKPLLANDPHLSLSSPSTWYFAHLKANEINVIGATIPGLPGVVLGHTPNIAWGFTNTAPDVQDLYLEAIDPKNPTHYKTPNGTELFQIRRETIFIKDKNPETILTRSTRHGPVISDAFAPANQLIDTKRFVLALRWTALDAKNQSIRALIDLNKAKTLEDLKSALEKFHAPMQNVVMADSDGKIALQLAGVAPRRQKNQGMMGVAPVFGWESKNDWKEYLKPNALPNQLGPDKTLLITANQKIEDKDSEFALTGDWTLPFRYQRIEELLKVSKQHDISSMQKIQSDTLSKASLALLPILNATQSKHPLAKEAKELLAQFNGDMRMDSAAALIYNAWVDQYTRAIFTPWLEDSFTEIYSKRSLLDGLIHITSNELNYWCDHPKTNQVENCNQLRSLALDTALSYLSKRYGNQISKWQWGQAHPAIGAHKPLSRIPIIKFWFEINAPSPGDMHTINVGRMNFNDPKEPYASTLAPGMRAVYDLSNLNESVFIGFGGQSGWIQSGRYQNYLDAWQKNQYLPLSITPKGPIQGELILKIK